MIKELTKTRILLTGSSGWLGNEVLCYLYKVVGYLNGLDVTCASSSEKKFLIHGEEIRSWELSKINPSQKFDLIIHLASVLPGTLNVDEVDKLSEMNDEITRLARIQFDANPDALKIILSSGAANFTSPAIHSREYVEYGKSKKRMEECLASENTLILRLWSTTGHHIPSNSNYAIAQFIRSAANHEQIVIQNNTKRTYVGFQDIFGASLQYLLDGGRGIINSGGDSVSMLQLVQTIIRSQDSRSQVIAKSPQVTAGIDYVSPACEIPLHYLQNFQSLEMQIRETASGLKERIIVS